jgi:hypothetical protein
MRRVLLAFATFALIPSFGAAQTSPVGAEELPPDHAADHLFTFPKRIHLTVEQGLELRALQEEFAPKLADAQKTIDSIMTPERKAARAEARKKAAAEGKKDAELAKAVRAAAPLSKDERARYYAALAAKDKLLGEVRRRKLDLLTPEQKSRLYQERKMDR